MKPIIESKINTYPIEVRHKFCELRSLILELAETHELGPIEETLKWGEPSFLNENGSTIRIDWKPKAPDKIYLFFNCKTILVETFREIFPDTFDYQEDRAIILDINKQTPKELEVCLLMALNYHKIKKRPLLGA